MPTKKFQDEENQKTIMQYYFDLECKLLSTKDTRAVEIKAAEAWGVLNAAAALREIDWDAQRRVFGELMSKMLHLR